VLIAFQRIAADQLGEAVCLVCISGPERPHLVQGDIDATLRELPGGFGTGKTCADDVYV
jgi:hypothetical protein